MTLDYSIGQSVHLKTDPEKAERLITGVFIRSNGVSYELPCGTQCSAHYAFEMATDKAVRQPAGFKIQQPKKRKTKN